MIKPLHDVIVVEPIIKRAPSASGLFIQSSESSKPTRGRVIAIGPGKHDSRGQRVPIPECITVGCVVAFLAGSLEHHRRVTEKGEEVAFFIRAEAVIGVEE